MEIIIKQLDSLLESINYEISLLSNTTAFIKQIIPDISWVGFYLASDENLILGPFQGLPACNEIPFKRGVCGACATNRTTIVVENVHEFPDHISCDSASNSEIVLPIILHDELYGVLDIDSTSFARFTTLEEKTLEAMILVIVKHLLRIKNIA